MNMKIQGQHDNTNKPSLGPLSDNKGVEHLWNMSGVFGVLEQDTEVPMPSRAQN